MNIRHNKEYRILFRDGRRESSSFNLLDLQNKNEIKGQEEIERKSQRNKEEGEEKEANNKNDPNRKQDRTEGLIPDHTTNFTPPFIKTYHDLLISTHRSVFAKNPGHNHDQKTGFFGYFRSKTFK